MKRLCLTVTSALALALVVPGSAVAQGGVGAVKTKLTCGLGHGRDGARTVHAGRLPTARDRLLERQERRRRGGEGPGQPRSGSSIFGGGSARASWCCNSLFDGDGFLYHAGQDVAGTVVGNVEIGYMLFGLVFCAVSLAIVWGTTLERIRFGAYVIYAAVFGAVIYPLIAHAVWSGDGLLDDIGGKEVLDAVSVVHLTGATGALAALLLLGARADEHGADGRPRAIPGHSMPLVGLGVAILWVGWYGFNAGSTLGTTDVAFAEVALNTQLAAAAGVIGACSSSTRRRDRSMSAWPATGRSRAWSRSRRPVVCGAVGGADHRPDRRCAGRLQRALDRALAR